MKTSKNGKSDATRAKVPGKNVTADAKAIAKKTSKAIGNAVKRSGKRISDT